MGIFDVVEKGNISAIKKHLSIATNVLARNHHHTVLHEAVRRNNREVVKLVLEKIKETKGTVIPFINAQDNEGDTPLMWSAESGYLNAALVLLEYGADAEAKNSKGMTALHWAALRNKMEVLKLLISKGSKVDVEDKCGQTPFDYAKEGRNGEMAGYLAFSMAGMFRNQGKHNKAWQAYEEAFNIQDVVLGPHHPATLSTRNNMAETLGNQRKYSEALDMYKEIFDIQQRKDVLGPKHPDTLKTRYNMAGVIANQSKYSEALTIYREIFDIQKKALGPDHPDTLNTRYNIAEMLDYQGQYSEALIIYQEIFDVIKRRNVLGPDHPDTLRTRYKIAGLLNKQGQYNEALAIYREIFDAQKRKDVLGPDHPETLMTRYAMAMIISDQGNYREALKIFSDVLKLQEAKFGSDHPVTSLTRNNIEIIKRKGAGAEILVSNKGDGKPGTSFDSSNKGGRTKAADATTNVSGSEESSSTCSTSEDSDEELEYHEHFELVWDATKAIKTGVARHFNYLYLVRGKDRGKQCWHYAFIDANKKEMFLEQSKKGSVDVAEYGESVRSGWGKNPPQKIQDKFKGFLKKMEHDLFVIKPKRKNMSVYHYVMIDTDKKEMFLERCRTGLVAVSEMKNYGKVLCSGWGRDPPESISHKIERAYLCTDESDLTDDFSNLSVKDIKALHDTARNGKLKALRNLIIKGVDVNSADKLGWTSLHHAAYAGDIKIVKCLIDSSADLHVKDTVCGRKPVHIAAREGHSEVTELFLTKNMNIHDADKNKWTLLHYASWSGRLRTVKLIIDKGSDMNAREAVFGKKPIHVAAEGGYLDIVNLFLASGASIEDTDRGGRTPLFYAACRGHLEVVKHLVHLNANIHAQAIHGTKPIHCAAAAGHEDVIEFFLNGGANVDSPNEDNDTPLHFAAHFGQLEVVQYLMNKGADVELKNKSGETPLDAARERGHVRVVTSIQSRRKDKKETCKIQ